MEDNDDVADLESTSPALQVFAQWGSAPVLDSHVVIGAGTEIASVAYSCSDCAFQLGGPDSHSKTSSMTLKGSSLKGGNLSVALQSHCGWVLAQSLYTADAFPLPLWLVTDTLPWLPRTLQPHQTLAMAPPRSLTASL